jgi:hypothetical protein
VNDRSDETPRSLRLCFSIAFACVLDRAIDLHVHDLKPGRKQPLRLLIGLEYGLQQSSETLSGGDTLAHQIFELRQIGSQRRDQQLDRNCGRSRCAAATDLVESDDQAVDFRPHPLRYFFELLCSDGGEQGRSRCNEPISRARDFQRTDCLRHAGIDPFEPFSDLARRIDASRGGHHCERADTEEREQQPPAYAKIPALQA